LIVNGSADTRVHLLGPSLSLSAKSGSGGLPAPASLAFRLPPKSDPTRVRIVRLVPGGSWVETPSTIGQRNGQSAAGASVQEAGTYALARIDHAEMR
jgi:hypothetical protein